MSYPLLHTLSSRIGIWSLSFVLEWSSWAYRRSSRNFCCIIFFSSKRKRT